MMDRQRAETRVLYLSYDGALEPLGQSQVVPYLVGLAARGAAITLVSFEKPAENRIMVATTLEVGAELFFFLAVKDEDVADYHYYFFHHMAASAPPCPSRSRVRIGSRQASAAAGSSITATSIATRPASYRQLFLSIPAQPT